MPLSLPPSNSRTHRTSNLRYRDRSLFPVLDRNNEILSTRDDSIRDLPFLLPQELNIPTKSRTALLNSTPRIATFKLLETSGLHYRSPIVLRIPLSSREIPVTEPSRSEPPRRALGNKTRQKNSTRHISARVKRNCYPRGWKRAILLSRPQLRAE